MSAEEWGVVLMLALATVGAAVVGVGAMWAATTIIERGRRTVGPEKICTTKILCCDGCGDLIRTRQTYRIDVGGYLLCVECAKQGDQQREVAV